MLRAAVLGAWELESYTEADGSGRPPVHPLGEDATGLIIYTDDGYMSAQLMSADRPLFDTADPAGGTTRQTLAAARGYLAYSGPFRVDESAAVLHHDVRVSLLPNWLGVTQIRSSKLDHDRLTLSLRSTRDGVETTSTLVWRRAQPSP